MLTRPDVATVVVLLGVLGACRQSRQGPGAGGNVSAPVQLVAEHLARDSRGERLQPSEWFRSTSVWEDEPAWDAVTLIRAFRVGQASIDGDTARVEVTYEIVGTLEGTPEGKPMRFVPRAGIDRVEFVLSSDRGHWLFVSPSINPHVLADSIQSYRPGILSQDQATLLDSLLRKTPP